MKIYNTLSRRKEDFVPLTPDEVRMYVCGVTVYDVSHIGHARSAIVFDVIRRYLLFKGYRVTFVKNFTDIDDKIIRRANADGVPAREVSERYIVAYRADMASLGVLAGDVEPKATEHIPQMVALIERLIAGGFAYVVEGDVYFEVRTFAAYGKLSGKNLDELLAGARVEVDERKRDPRDFALWKSAKPGEPSWPSLWGPGRPGWHIECSAMSMQYLGESFDLHGGGEDLIFPHHECEIAQSEAATHKSFVKLWVHNGFVNMGAEKMSKSLGNTLMIGELLKRHDPDVLRLWLLGTHYRSPVEFTDERLAGEAIALQGLRNVVVLARTRAFGAGVPMDEPSSQELANRKIEEIRRQIRDEGLRHRVGDLMATFVSAMDDDFNTPQARAALFALASVANSQSDRVDRILTSGARQEAAGPLEDFVHTAQILWIFARTVGLLYHRVDVPKAYQAHDATIKALVDHREEARKRRDWKMADELRAQLLDLGVVVEDRPDGPYVKPRES